MNAILDIAKRRTEIGDEIAALRQKRGAALLSGKKLNGAKIAELEAEAEALAEAEAEAARLERAEAAEIRRGRTAAARHKLADLESKRLAAVRDAHNNARDLAEALSRALSIGADMTMLLGRLGTGVPMTLGRFEIDSRMGGRVSATMVAASGSRRLGSVVWMPAIYSGSDDWAEEERRIVGRQLNPIINGESNGNSSGKT